MEKERIRLEVSDEFIEILGFEKETQEFVWITRVQRGSEEGKPLTLFDMHQILRVVVDKMSMPINLAEAEIEIEDKRDFSRVEQERKAELARVDKIAEERMLN